MTGWGTGGTLTGVAEMLKLARPEVRIVAAEPAVASLLQGDEFQSHKIQGWVPDFIPEVLNEDVVDEIRTVTDERARDVALQLAQREGIFCGISSGATAAAALELAGEMEPGSAVLAMLPDTGERYLSTYLFEDLAQGSDDEWLAGL